MGRHSSKKFKKEELNKVKFRLGRKLPKNLNETRAQFKTKTLILKQQFQLEKDGPVSHRNLTLKVIFQISLKKKKKKKFFFFFFLNFYSIGITRPSQPP